MHVERNKQLSGLCTFGIGGPALYFIEAKSIEDLQQAFVFADEQKCPFLLIGKGSNCLFDDRGFDGVVISNKISFFTQDEGSVSAGAGYSFSLLGVQTARNGWSGLEFASGIPASVGGAVYMNAGANGKETCQTLSAVTYVHVNGEVKVYKREDLQFGYRHSSFQNMKGAIAAATFALSRSDSARSQQLEIIDYRTKTQPYGERSAGCVFRNPPGAAAGALIDQCGLKGMRIGGAEVSVLHGNFIVNRDHATARDVGMLAEYVKSIIKERVGVELELEIRMIPYQIT